MLFGEPQTKSRTFGPKNSSVKTMISKYCGTSIKIIIGIDVSISKVCFNLTHDASHMGQQSVLALSEGIHFSRALCLLTFP